MVRHGGNGGRQKDAGRRCPVHGRGRLSGPQEKAPGGRGRLSGPREKAAGEEGASRGFRRGRRSGSREKAPGREGSDGSAGEGSTGKKKPFRIRGRIMLCCGEGASRVRGPVLLILQQAGPGSPGWGLPRHREGYIGLTRNLSIPLPNL